MLGGIFGEFIVTFSNRNICRSKHNGTGQKHYGQNK